MSSEKPQGINPGDHVNHIIQYASGEHDRPEVGVVLETKHIRGIGYEYTNVEVRWVSPSGDMTNRIHAPEELKQAAREGEGK